MAASMARRAEDKARLEELLRTGTPHGSGKNRDFFVALSYNIPAQATHTMNAERWLQAGFETLMNPGELEHELERLHEATFGWALWCCRQRREDAEEVLQTVYVKVLEGRAHFSGKAGFRTWLFGVVRHTAAEQRRRRRLRDALLLKWYGARTAPAPCGPEISLRGHHRSHELRQALDQLPRRQREVLHLVFYQEMTVGEAACALNVSLGTARTHFERGKSRLRQLLTRMEKYELKRV